MAVDPRIALQVRAPDLGKAFSNSLMSLQQIDQLQRSKAEAPLRNRLLEAQTQTAEGQVPTGQESLNRDDLAAATSIVQGALQVNSIPDTNDRLTFLKSRREKLIERGKQTGVPVDTADTDLVISKLESGDVQGAQQLIDSGIQLGSRLGIINSSGGLTAGQRELNSLTEGFSDEDIITTRRIKAGLDPRATGSASQTILKQGTAEQVGDVEAIIGEKKKLAEETGSSKAKLKFKPQIEKAVIKAKALATERGESFTDLSRMQAALPNLKESVSELKELSAIATSTIGGKIFDSAVKQSGFGSTKGATARAKFIAIVNNQVLPLLKPTFGAAFTVQEGETLKATMGDPDASPEEKMAQLDAFITQKQRDIETKQNQLGIDQAEDTTQEPPSIKFLGFE